MKRIVDTGFANKIQVQAGKLWQQWICESMCLSVCLCTCVDSVRAVIDARCTATLT